MKKRKLVAEISIKIYAPEDEESERRIIQGKITGKASELIDGLVVVSQSNEDFKEVLATAVAHMALENIRDILKFVGKKAQA